MSHDLYASWATVEISRMIKATPPVMLAAGVNSNNLNVFANRESGRVWPIPDGRISAETTANKFEVALEMKRTNEGLHGILTAIGQSQAYIHKGYSGSAIVIPKSYDSHSTPGNYVSDVINNTRIDLPIGVFIYDTPDTSSASPFLNKLTCIRQIGLTLNQTIQTGNFLLSQKSSTQWAHLREGSSESFAFFKYLQNAKHQNATNPTEPTPNFPAGLISAVNRLNAGANPLHYLSNATGLLFHDVVWRNFWFTQVFTNSVSKIWTKAAHVYSVNNVATELVLADGSKQFFFSGRTDSIKNKIVDELNAGTITENEAWEKFALNVHNRAHSYREDIDSGLEHLGLIDSDGKPSDAGYKFVDACERTNDCHSGKPWLILGSSILKEGGLAAFLHYIYKVSEKKFKQQPLAFTTAATGGRRTFDQGAYLTFLRNELANTLHVMNTATLRGGVQRNAFQGEFAILRKFDFVQRFRVGVGLEINWPLVQEFLEFEI
jgi:hypothetical protein